MVNCFVTPPVRTRMKIGVPTVAEGRTNAEIAALLWVSPRTVKKHLEGVYEKLGVHTRTAAAAIALRAARAA